MKGFTCGAFDLLHTGHIVMLRECKENCDYLIVGLQVDPSVDRSNKNRPIQSVYERYVQLKACRYVDEIIPYDTEQDLENMMATLDIGIRFVGAEYAKTYITGQGTCELRNIKIRYNASRLHGYSSTSIRKRILYSGQK